MAEPSTHINYSFEDIQRYLNGGMSAAEMHDMEKAALQDPFLADAIEGFNEANLTTAQQHINEINATLIKEKKQSKVVAFNKKTQWLNIAAVIIVLAGIGIVISYFLRPSAVNQETNIAQVNQQPDENKTASDSMAIINNEEAFTKKKDTDLLMAANKPAAKKELLKAKQQAVNEKELLPTNEAREYKADDDNIAAAAPVIAEQSKTETASYAGNNVAGKNIDSLKILQGRAIGVTVLPATFSGKVVDESNQPIAGVTITSADDKAAVLSDINGNFNLQKTDTLLTVTASSAGYNSRNIALKQGLNKPIILNEANNSLNEVVVVGYGKTRKKNTYADSLIRRKQKEYSGNAVPIGGWENFNNYVVSQLQKDTTAAATNPRNLVELEFLIDKAGNPYNIVVKKSFNNEHSKKAVEIIKNGPQWTVPIQTKKTRLTISF